VDVFQVGHGNKVPGISEVRDVDRGWLLRPGSSQILSANGTWVLRDVTLGLFYWPKRHW